MAPKRKAEAEPGGTRKRVRGGKSESPTVPKTTKTTRSGRVSVVPDQKTSTTSKSTATSKKASKQGSTAARQDNEYSSRSKTTQSLKPNIAEEPGIKDLPEALQVKRSHSDDAGSQSKGKDGKQYWLMKAEPEDRFENGYNVKFSIDDLEAASEPEPWDGVRNYVARNNMRAMKEGDLAFFYHSNCKVPGIVGIMRIVQEHTVDESAFDPKHPYYDQKSQRDKPRWDLVHVGFVKKFNDKISLKDIQNNAASTKELSEMELLKYKWLSITAVKPHEWKFIVNWAGESPTVGESTK